MRLTFVRSGVVCEDIGALVDQFNSLMQDRNMVFFDEFRQARAGDMNKVNNAITGRTQMIRALYRDGVVVKSYIRIMAAADRIDMLPLHHTKNRRWAIFEANPHFANNRAEGELYFKQLHAAIHDNDYGAIKALAWHLKHCVDVSDFNHGIGAPITKLHRAMQEKHLDSVTRWWRTCLRRGYHLRQPQLPDMDRRYLGNFVCNEGRIQAADGTYDSAWVRTVPELSLYTLYATETENPVGRSQFFQILETLTVINRMELVIDSNGTQTERRMKHVVHESRDQIIWRVTRKKLGAAAAPQVAAAGAPGKSRKRKRTAGASDIHYDDMYQSVALNGSNTNNATSAATQWRDAAAAEADDEHSTGEGSQMLLTYAQLSTLPEAIKFFDKVVDIGVNQDDDLEINVPQDVYAATQRMQILHGKAISVVRTADVETSVANTTQVAATPQQQAVQQQQQPPTTVASTSTEGTITPGAVQAAMSDLNEAEQQTLYNLMSHFASNVDVNGIPTVLFEPISQEALDKLLDNVYAAQLHAPVSVPNGQPQVALVPSMAAPSTTEIGEPSAKRARLESHVPTKAPARYLDIDADL